MCIKRVYHNTYIDGDRDVTERVETCRPGHMCANPQVKEYDRRVGCTRLQLSSSPHRADTPLYLADRRPSSPYYAEQQHLRPPTPRSGHASGSDHSDRDREKRYRKRGSGIYLNDDKVMDIPGRKRERERRGDRVVIVDPPHAPTPPAPIPIPKIRRSTTMPTGGVFVVDAQPERRAKPIIIENSNRSPRRNSGAIPNGATVEITDHASRLHRYPSRRDYLEPHHPRRPSEMYRVEDDYERAERRRRRREAKTEAEAAAAAAAAMAQPVPAEHVYGSSPYGSSWGSSATANSNYATPSPAVAAVKKELRWEDQQRAVQNARIQARPKLTRSSTLQGEVRGILKNNGPRVPVAKDDMDTLYASMRGLSMQDQETGAPNQTRQDKEYADRLRSRFDMHPRRFTVAPTNKRRSEVYYPEEGRYKFM